MTFASFRFLLVFLPLILAVYELAGRKKKEYALDVLTAGSLLFYSFFGWDMTALLLLQCILNYYLCRMLAANRRKAVFAAAVSLNVLILIFFRYTNFFIDCFNGMMKSSVPGLSLLVPVGISYYTFQLTALLSDIYSGAVMNMNFREYLFYMLYFPKMIQGPILQYPAFMKQIDEAGELRVRSANLAYGLELFSIGMAKKILMADTFGKAVDYTYSHIGSSGSISIIASAVFYSLQLYLDFSGYCDMACGISWMFGIRLPHNFRAPYRAVSIGDFWKRWHISLTDFLRKYIYFPMGGSRRGKARTYLNIMIIFLISGFWHGADWTFILWGFLHGVLSCADRMIGKSYEKLPKVLRWLITMMLVTVLWMLFRSESLTQFAQLMKQLVKPGNFRMTGGLVDFDYFPVLQFLDVFIEGNQWLEMLAGMGLLTLAGFAVCLLEKEERIPHERFTRFSVYRTAVLLIWSMLSLSSIVTFLYQRF